MVEGPLTRTRSLGKRLKTDLRDAYWTWYGRRLRNPDLPSNVRAILFVCKGNICRSPFAEHLASKLGTSGNDRGIVVGSAGLAVPNPKSPPETAIRVAKRFGVDLEEHMSRPMTGEMIDAFDMVVAMEVWHHRALSARFERQRHKLFLLPLFDPDRSVAARGYAAFNIEDPYGGSSDRFASCFAQIERCLVRFFALINVQRVRTAIR